MVYHSKLLERACFYPSHDATHAMNPYKDYGRPWGGEIMNATYQGGAAVHFNEHQADVAQAPQVE